MKNKVKFFAVFYQSTLANSLSVSFLLAVIGIFGGPLLVLKLFAVSFMVAGSVLSLLYKEMTQSGEYYFYYNVGITKLQLISCCVLLNILIGLVLFTVASYAHP